MTELSWNGATFSDGGFINWGCTPNSPPTYSTPDDEHQFERLSAKHLAAVFQPSQDVTLRLESGSMSKRVILPAPVRVKDILDCMWAFYCKPLDALDYSHISEWHQKNTESFHYCYNWVPFVGGLDRKYTKTVGELRGDHVHWEGLSQNPDGSWTPDFGS